MFAKSDVLPILIRSRVNRYLEFKPLSSFHTYENDSFDRVPGTREAIFTDQTLSLMTKRNVMRFMKFVLEYDDPSLNRNSSNGGNSENTPNPNDIWKPYANKPVSTFMKEKFRLGDEQITELVYTIGLSSSPQITTINALARMKRYLSSLGIYGNFPALYSTYGSAGELVQAFSRSAAVAGATYKLDTGLVSFDKSTSTATLSDGSKVKVNEQLILSANSLMKFAHDSNFSISTSNLTTPQGSLNDTTTFRKKSISQYGSISPSLPPLDTQKRNFGSNGQDLSPTTPTVNQSGIGSGLLQEQQTQKDSENDPVSALPSFSSKTNKKGVEIVRMVAIVGKDCKEWFSEGEQAAVVVFPPFSLPTENKHAVQAIVMGSGTGQCPNGQAIWYLSTIEPNDNSSTAAAGNNYNNNDFSTSFKPSTPIMSVKGEFGARRNSDVNSNNGTKARLDLEEALKKLEASILRESTEDFNFPDVTETDVSVRPDGMPVLSSVKLGQSLQNFVPKEKLQYLLKLCYTQKLKLPKEIISKVNSSLGVVINSKTVPSSSSNEGEEETDKNGADKVTVVGPPLVEISYDGVVDETIKIYKKIVGSDDDFFDLDFDDEDEEKERSEAMARAAAALKASSSSSNSSSSNNNNNNNLSTGALNNTSRIPTSNNNGNNLNGNGRQFGHHFRSDSAHTITDRRNESAIIDEDDEMMSDDDDGRVPDFSDTMEL